MGEALRILVLSVIASGETHGYEIRNKITQLTCGAMKISPGTLYPLLFIMKKQGLIEVTKEETQGRKRKVYHITPKGKKYLLTKLPTTIKYLKETANYLEKIQQTIEKQDKTPKHSS